MINKVSVKSMIQSIILVSAGLLMGLFLMGDGLVGRSLASAEPQPAQPAQVEIAAPAAPASPNEVWGTCVPVSVASFGNRAHVECAAAISGIRFFAVSTANPAHVARILSVLSTAQVAGRTLSILYDPVDTSGASFHCQASDCRIISAVAFGQ